MTEEISGVIFGVWFLIGAALVFWMQAGFAMVEAGFTRAKNTGNTVSYTHLDVYKRQAHSTGRAKVCHKG